MIISAIEIVFRHVGDITLMPTSEVYICILLRLCELHFV